MSLPVQDSRNSSYRLLYHGGNHCLYVLQIQCCSFLSPACHLQVQYNFKRYFRTQLIKICLLKLLYKNKLMEPASTEGKVSNKACKK